MKYINEEKIFGLIDQTRSQSRPVIEKILKKALALKRLTLKESAVLLNTEDPQTLEAIYQCAAYVKESIYGKRIVLFVPLYVSNICSNDCAYCAFRKDNRSLARVALSQEQVQRQTSWLLGRGHKRILMVAGESSDESETNARFYVRMMEAIYRARSANHYIRRVNVNCAPLPVREFKLLKRAGIGTYQLFQESYHEDTYRALHTKGPKADPDRRIRGLEDAFNAGIDDLGVGVLYGLYDHKFETLALLSHIERLEKKFNVGPHTISVPRIEPASGTDFYQRSAYKVSDNDFKKLVAVLRLSVPYTGMILSTRENQAMRDELFKVGISQVSAESRTAPGGYNHEDTEPGQFTIGDTRNLDEVIGALIESDFVPSFCAACYRKHRTGERFMDLAKPGTIKGKCNINAMVTLKEYLDDFASSSVKTKGYKLLEREKENLDNAGRRTLTGIWNNIEKGGRDEYV